MRNIKKSKNTKWKVKLNLTTTDRRKKCSINERFGGHFVFLCRLLILKQLPIL